MRYLQKTFLKNSEIRRFRWWNEFDDMCKISQGSFWSMVWRKSVHFKWWYVQKDDFLPSNLKSSHPVIRVQCPHLHQIWIIYGSPISRKLKVWDRQTVTVNKLESYMNLSRTELVGMRRSTVITQPEVGNCHWLLFFFVCLTANLRCIIDNFFLNEALAMIEANEI